MLNFNLATKSLIDNYGVPSTDLIEPLGLSYSGVYGRLAGKGDSSIKVVMETLNAAGIGLKLSDADGAIAYYDSPDIDLRKDLKEIIAQKGSNMRAIAKQVGKDDTTLRDSLRLYHITALLYSYILDILGIKYEFYAIKSGYRIQPYPKASTRYFIFAKGGKKYYVTRSYPISNTYWSEGSKQIGDNGAEELFVAEDGTLFSVYTDPDPDKKQKKVLYTKEEAIDFVKAHGRLAHIKTDAADIPILKEIDEEASIKLT